MLSESAELPRGLQDLQLGSLRILTGGEKVLPAKRSLGYVKWQTREFIEFVHGFLSQRTRNNCLKDGAVEQGSTETFNIISQC